MSRRCSDSSSVGKCARGITSWTSRSRPRLHWQLDDTGGEKIVLLVSDINMPGMSGLDLIPEVKARRPEVPVFMISDYGDAERVKIAVARGADEFLTKPIDFPKLKQDIMAVMTGATEGNG
jgi:DNA-binding NtrC family response regulator